MTTRNPKHGFLRSNLKEIPKVRPWWASLITLALLVLFVVSLAPYAAAQGVNPLPPLLSAPTSPPPTLPPAAGGNSPTNNPSLFLPTPPPASPAPLTSPANPAPQTPPASPPANNSGQVGFPYWPGANGQPPLLPCTGLECVDLCQLLLLFQRLIYFGMTIAVEVAAPVLLLWGALLILISGGSPERVSKGKTVLTSTIVGIVITLGAFLIVTTFLHLLGNTQGHIDPKTGQPAYVSWPNIACEVQ